MANLSKRCIHHVLLLTSAGAACMPAHGQSSLTLYGVFDTSIEATNPGAGWTARMDSGAYRGSRVGLRGEEALGGGTRVRFVLENGFGSNDGSFATPGTLFNRQAWIGAVGDWGELRAGRQYSPIYIPFKGTFDAFGAGTIASGLNNLSKITPYVNDAFTYLSPKLAGFQLTVMGALRAPGDNDGNGIAGNIETLTYESGPFRAGFAHQSTHGSGALRANIYGASYTFNRLTVYADGFNGDGGGTPRYHDSGLATSARYRLTSAWSASLGYARAWDLSAQHHDADQFSLMSEYQMSPTLQFYASAGWLRNFHGGTATLRGVTVTGLPPSWPGAPVKGVQIGMIDRF